MAWITRKKTSKGETRYLVGFREPGTGKRVHESFHRLEQARDRKREIEIMLDQGTYAPKSQRKTPLSEAIRSMIESGHDLEPSTIDWYRRSSALVIERLGHRPIGDVTRGELQAFVDRLVNEGVGKGRLESIQRLLVKVFKKAVAEGVLPRSPMGSGLDRVVFPKRRSQEAAPIEPDEVEALADAITPPFRAAVLVSAYAGLRAGEVAALREEDVDFLKGTITVRQAVQTVASRPRITRPKTKSSLRQIDVPTFLTEELARHIERFGTADDGRLFRAPQGTRTGATPADLASYQTLNKALAIAADKVGVDKPRWHQFRHTAVSLAIQAGAHPKMIQAIVGHADIQTTLNVYGHLMPGMGRQVADALQAAHEGRKAEGKVVAITG
jgi:integrase